MKLSRSILALASSMVAIFCIASTSSAQVWGGIGSGNGGSSGDIRRPDPSPYDPVQPGYPGGDDRGRREIYIGQYFRDQNIDLISLLRLNQGFQGARIQAVEVLISDAGPRTSLGLIANGMVVDQQSYLSNYTTLVPNQNLQVGYNLRNLDLAIRGKLFIERIAVSLEETGYPGYPDPGNPGPGNPGQNQIVLQARINQSFINQGSVDLIRATALLNYRGYQITSLMVNGRSIDNAFSRAQVLVNGTIDGEVLLSPQGGNYQVYPRGSYIIGRNLNALNLLVNRAQIGTVEIRLTRF